MTQRAVNIRWYVVRIMCCQYQSYVSLPKFETSLGCLISFTSIAGIKSNHYILIVQKCINYKLGSLILVKNERMGEVNPSRETQKTSKRWRALTSPELS